jgi:hypothetical protein
VNLNLEAEPGLRQISGISFIAPAVLASVSASGIDSGKIKINYTSRDVPSLVTSAGEVRLPPCVFELRVGFRDIL